MYRRKEVIGDCTLYLGNCMNLMGEISKASGLLIDPPYGINYKSGHNRSRRGAGKKMTREENFAPIAGDDVPFDPTPFLQIGIPSVIWGANHFCNSLPPKRRWLIWNKLCEKTPTPSGSDVEMAWCSQSGPDRIFNHLWRGIMRAGEENIVHSKKHHPNQKPVALMSWSLQFLSDGMVADCFMGSGTTGVACVRAGRPFIGVELDEGYFETACERISREHSQPNMFVQAARPKVEEQHALEI